MAAGKKHTLIIYHRTMDRLWRPVLLLSFALFALWRFGSALTHLYRPQIGPLVLAAAVYTGGFGLFAWLARGRGYVRAFDDYLLIASPFFRFKTSFERFRGVRSVDFHRLFELRNLSWTEERYTAPMIGKTAVVVRLSRYPLSLGLLSAFFHRYLFSPKDTELVLLVHDWMGFSVELDSRYNDFRQRRRRRLKPTGFQRGVSS